MAHRVEYFRFPKTHEQSLIYCNAFHLVQCGVQVSLQISHIWTVSLCRNTNILRFNLRNTAVVAFAWPHQLVGLLVFFSTRAKRFVSKCRHHLLQENSRFCSLCANSAAFCHGRCLWWSLTGQIIFETHQLKHHPFSLFSLSIHWLMRHCFIS